LLDLAKEDEKSNLKRKLLKRDSEITISGQKPVVIRKRFGMPPFFWGIQMRKPPSGITVAKSKK